MSLAKKCLEMSEAESKGIKVKAIKQDANKEISVGDFGVMTRNKDGSVRVMFDQRDTALDFKKEAHAMKFVKISEEKIDESNDIPKFLSDFAKSWSEKRKGIEKENPELAKLMWDVGKSMADDLRKISRLARK